MTSETLDTILKVLFIGGVVGGVYLVLRRGKQALQRRLRVLEEYAAQRGWSVESEEPGLLKRFKGAPFREGHSHTVSNVLKGRSGQRQVVIFDYRYALGHPRYPEHFVVIATPLGYRAPNLSVGPTSTADRRFAMTRFNPRGPWIDRITDEEIEVGSKDFHRAFRVKTDDPDFARKVLDERLTEMLLRWPRLGWRFERDSMVVILDGRPGLEAIKTALEAIDQILRSIPHRMWYLLPKPGRANWM